jgi:chromosome segregation ATPase
MATINLFQKLAHPGGTDKLRTALSELVASNSVAQQENTLYKKKLEEANAYVERLEDGYRQLLQRNAQLRTVVAADRSSISRLGTIIKQNTAQLLSLKEEMASATEDLQAGKCIVFCWNVFSNARKG